MNFNDQDAPLHDCGSQTLRWEDYTIFEQETEIWHCRAFSEEHAEKLFNEAFQVTGKAPIFIRKG